MTRYEFVMGSFAALAALGIGASSATADTAKAACCCGDQCNCEECGCCTDCKDGQCTNCDDCNCEGCDCCSK